jgi:hypothetical protein
MKIISNKIHNLLQVYQAKCPDYKEQVCNSERCDCRILAEIWAHAFSIIPDPYHTLTLQDFTGMKNGSVLLPTKTVAAAKDSIIKYCWQGIEPGEDYDAQKWLPKSIMDKRLASGSSIIIYGNPWTHDNSKGQIRTFKKPMGRTMLAGIVMKEAIFQRVKPEHACDSYEWVAFNTLTHRLLAQANGSHDFDDIISNYAEVDWLCVDGLQTLRGNEGGRSFIASVLDRLFSERLDRNLPNILVFQDDISKVDEIQQDFGIAINTIVNSRKTHRVALEGK